jgi:hypothetical protein
MKKFSIKDSIRFQRNKKLESREERRKRLKAWAGMTRSLLKARGHDPSNLSDAKAAMMFYRRRKKPMERITQERFFDQARQATLKSIGVGNG